LLPSLTGSFVREFVSADAPCFVLRMVEEGKRRCWWVALRPDRAIPREISNGAFRFGHGLLGNDNFEVVHFAFEFYGFETHNALVNPNNPVARAVLTTMVESGDYFFFALDSNESTTAFRSDVGQGNLTMLKSSLGRIRRSTTTEAQYDIPRRTAISTAVRHNSSGSRPRSLFTLRNSSKRTPSSSRSSYPLL
jgi:hypothetical protein